MPKFVFDVPSVRVMIDAADQDEAWDRAEQLLPIVLECKVNAPDGLASWPFEIRSSGGRPEPVKACVVCGCTNDAACPGGCAWLTADLCDTADAAHEKIARMQGVEDLTLYPKRSARR